MDKAVYEVSLALYFNRLKSWQRWARKFQIPVIHAV